MAISPGLSVNRVKPRVHFDMPESRNGKKGFGGEYSSVIGGDPDSFGVVLVFPLDCFSAVVPLETILKFLCGRTAGNNLEL